MGQNFEKKNDEIFENKIFVDKYDLIYWKKKLSRIALKCGDIEYELYVLSMNSVSGRCLCLRDTALYLTVMLIVQMASRGRGCRGRPWGTG